MRFRSKIIYLSLLCLLFLLPVSAAPSRSITPQQWQQLTSDKDFGYKNELEKQVTPPDTKPSKWMIALMKFFKFLGKASGQTILWVIFAIVIIYIVYKLVLSNEMSLFQRRGKKQLADSDTDLEEIGNADWDKLLQKAVNNNDLQQAVRFSYMWLLQMLQDGQLIRYRDDKTNFEYYKELEKTVFKQPFKQISRQYEYVIYGNYHITAADYNAYIDLFNNVKKQLGK